MARISLRIDGATVEAEAGLTVATVLWNLGRRRLGRSVTGSPRGPLCGMGVCFECRVTIDGIPHRRACLEPVASDMEVVTDG
ncbi:MAG TPA: (2Fe-2S)-binding protein [Vicinamibacteria bacterium]|nr:(2Fe-2S)-binding protein [Vicinamibacteria bacterium]